MYSNRFELEEILSSLDEVLGYLNPPGITENDCVTVAKKLKELLIC